MAEFPVTCSCGTEFIAQDEGVSEIECPTCGNRLRLLPEFDPPPDAATGPFFRCPVCDRPVEHERIFSCPRCGADLRPGGTSQRADDTYHRLILRGPDGPPPPFYGRLFWILFRPTRFFHQIRFEDGFHAAGLFYLCLWVAVTPLVGVTIHAEWARRSLQPDGGVAETVGLAVLETAAVALPFLLFCTVLWAALAHLVGSQIKYESDVGAMMRVACYASAPLGVGVMAACLLVLVQVHLSIFTLAAPFLFWTLLLQVIGVSGVARVVPESSWLIAFTSSAVVGVIAALATTLIFPALLAA